MATSTSRGPHVPSRPWSSSRVLSRQLDGPQGPRLERRQARRPDIYTHTTGPGYLAISSVQKIQVQRIQFGNPEEWPVEESIQARQSGKTRFSYHVVLSKYEKDKIDHGYDLNLVETITDIGKGEAKQNKVASFRFGSDVKLEVHLLPVFQEIQLLKQPNNLGELNKEEDVLWTLSLAKQPKNVFFQVQKFLKDFQRCLEQMPLSQLGYANVNRQLIGPAPVSYLHIMQSRRKPFVIDVPGGPHWEFTGHLSDPLLMARVAHLTGGLNSEQLPPTAKLGNNTQGAKGKARRRKKAEKAAKAAKALEEHKDSVQYNSEQHESNCSEPVPSAKRSAPQSSRQGKKRCVG